MQRVRDIAEILTIHARLRYGGGPELAPDSELPGRRSPAVRALSGLQDLQSARAAPIRFCPCYCGWPRRQSRTT